MTCPFAAISGLGRRGGQRTLTNPEGMLGYVQGLSAGRLDVAQAASQTFDFQASRFYAEKVLLGTPDDPGVVPLAETNS